MFQRLASRVEHHTLDSLLSVLLVLVSRMFWLLAHLTLLYITAVNCELYRLTSSGSTTISLPLDMSSGLENPRNAFVAPPGGYSAPPDPLAAFGEGERVGRRGNGRSREGRE